MKTFEEFKEFFDEELIEYTKNIDEQRKITKPKIKRLDIFILICFVILLVIFIYLYSQNMHFSKIRDYKETLFISALTAFLIVLIPYCILFSKINKKYDYEFNNFLNRLVKFVDVNLSFDPLKNISKQSLSSSNIFFFKNPLIKVKSGNSIYGKINNLEINISDAYIVRKSIIPLFSKTVFSGVFILADFNKEFKGQTVILPDTVEKKLGWFSNYIQKLNPLRSQLVKLENINFEKKFVVYSDNQITSRYILSTAFMERILDLKARFYSNIYLSFVDSKIYIAVERLSSKFIPQYFDELNSDEIKNPVIYRDYYEFLNTILFIIETLKLL